jgi:hypothetical protein
VPVKKELGLLMFRKAAELKDPNGMFIWATI